MDTLLRQLDELPVGRGDGALFSGRAERRMAKAVGLSQFGVNHVTLEPGARTASRHWHEAEDEFVYVLSGDPTLVDENGRHELNAGSIVGFPAGVPNAHHVLNETSEPAVLIVVGSRRPGKETIHYPDDDFGPIRK
jgi:uncharacterized cupin superfamily protein